MKVWTDAELIGYCEIHCKTERALFSVEHVNRMLNLAGQPAFPPYVKGFIVAHEEMDELCKMARARLANPAPASPIKAEGL